LRGLQEGYRLSLTPAWLRFRAAAQAPRLAQRAALLRVLSGAEGTRFAQDHGLERVRCFEDYQAAVPIRDHEGHRPYLERAVQGEPRVLTAEAPRLFERTSGSSGVDKLIPYTPALLREFAAATGPWLHDLYTRRPALRDASAYWSISPLTRRAERTPGGDRIGIEDDAEYFPKPVRRLLRVLLPVPPSVAQLPDVAACRYVTLRHLLADPCLGLLSVWNPSFLTLLLTFAQEHAEALADDVAHGTLTPPAPLPAEAPAFGPFAPDPEQGAAIRAAFLGAGPPDLRRVWPRLSLVSCWTDAAAAGPLAALRPWLPAGVEVQGKGLLATEGVVSFPLLGHEGGVLAVASHLLELQPVDDLEARPVLPHQAEVGGVYRPILSTGGGLYRYPLGDAIEVIGRAYATPRVRFLGRIDGVSDLRGEKLAPAHVEAALDAALAPLGPLPFRLLAPGAGDPPSYVLYLEGANDTAGLAEDLDRRLQANHAYAYCRELGQLGPVTVRAVTAGQARYEEALVARGQRAGDLKPPGLHRGDFWGAVYGSQAIP
jgi:hypothetical protein